MKAYEKLVLNYKGRIDRMYNEIIENVDLGEEEVETLLRYILSTGRQKLYNSKALHRSSIEEDFEDSSSEESTPSKLSLPSLDELAHGKKPKPAGTKITTAKASVNTAAISSSRASSSNKPTPAVKSTSTKKIPTAPPVKAQRTRKGS